MNISVKDAGNYFRGLLLLIGKDQRITESEAKLVKRVGKALGFEKEFCDNAIHDILVNNYITDDPPIFSSMELAKKFIRDGFVIAISDNELHTSEFEWLKSVAKKNGVDSHWIAQEKENIKKNINIPPQLEAEEFTIIQS